MMTATPLPTVFAAVCSGLLQVSADSGTLAKGGVLSQPTPAQVATVPARDSLKSLIAARVSLPPNLDGRDDDPAWRSAPATTEFSVFSPVEGATPSFRTEVRAVHDDRALYVLVRSFDPRPDSLIGRLARRDTDGLPNDQVQVFIDSYHDRRNGYEYIVNPAGVKSDYLLFNDSDWDQSWDGIWSVATAIDSLGWVAEFAIPFQQLRFRGAAPRFGFMVWRVVGRLGERVSWPQYRSSDAGLVSQAGSLVGITGLSPRAGIDVSPYMLGQIRSGALESDGRHWRSSAGVDATFTPQPNVSLTATFNPDFGQVEADPAVLNLSGFEVQQAERRPFFLEGSGLLNFPLIPDGSALLFYSRRIGRRPILAGPGDSHSTETTILGAGRVNARLGHGVSVGALSAVTAEESIAAHDSGERQVIEPRAHYGVAAGQYEFRGGRSGLGFILTRVDRGKGDSLASAMLPDLAQSAAVSVRHGSSDGDYQINAWAAGSDVQGSEGAIGELQLSQVRAFQRPDDDIAFDASRTSLRGGAASVSIAKVGGATRFGASYRWLSPSFDVNEAGYLARVGVQTVEARIGLERKSPLIVAGIPFRSASTTIRFAGDWTTAGLPHARRVEFLGNLELPSQAEILSRVEVGLPGAYCTVYCTRGGPAVVHPPQHRVALDFLGNPRRALVPTLSLQVIEGDGGRSTAVRAEAAIAWRLRSNLLVQFSALASDFDFAWFFYRRFGDPLNDTTVYTVAALDQDTRSFTARLDHTITPALSLQWYGQAFLSRGRHSDVRELADPRSLRYEDRFRPFRHNDELGPPGGIDLREARSNAVFRWEYRPGSTLFVVWSHAWEKSTDDPGSVRLIEDVRELFNLPAQSTFAVKLSYRFAR